jgi:hypothetical protein
MHMTLVQMNDQQQKLPKGAFCLFGSELSQLQSIQIKVFESYLINLEIVLHTRHKKKNQVGIKSYEVLFLQSTEVDNVFSKLYAFVISTREYFCRCPIFRSRLLFAL